jgi:hypothetical protein
VLFGALAPLQASSLPQLAVDLSGTDLFANIPFDEGDFQIGGTLHLSHALDSPTLPPGSGIVEGYADESGTFWAASRTGFIPYIARANVQWSETFVKNGADDTVTAEITGAHILMQYFGGLPGYGLLGRVEFYVWVGSDRQKQHIAEITRPENGDFMLSESGDFLGSTSYGADASTADWIMEPISVELDLSSIQVGSTFTVDYIAFVRAEGAGGETTVSAFFRDPVSMTGGVTITPNGPTPVPEPAHWLLLGVGALVLRAASARR